MIKEEDAKELQNAIDNEGFGEYFMYYRNPDELKKMYKDQKLYKLAKQFHSIGHELRDYIDDCAGGPL